MYVDFSTKLGECRRRLPGTAAEEFAKDPRNPYAAQIAKESHH